MSGSCCVEPGAKQIYVAQGSEDTIAGVNAYKTGVSHGHGVVIIIFTDIFGYTFVNTRKIADQFAEEVQATVLVPDLFNGDPLDPNEKDLIGKLPAWRLKHKPEDACILAEKILAVVKECYQSIQIIGFCYGAKPVVHLISRMETCSCIQSAIVGHPSLLDTEEPSTIKRPILFLCAETDQRFTSDLRNKYEQQLKENKLGVFIDYPGTVHGFVVRPDGTSEVEKQRNKAVKDAIQWFNEKKHLQE